MTSPAPPYRIHTNNSEGSLRAPTLPPYTEHAGATEDIELASLSPSSSASSSHAASAAAGSATSVFAPTKQLQIQTQGKSLLSFPGPTRPDPIPIFTLTAAGHLDRPQYLSIRPRQRSGTCFLAHGDDETQALLTTTTYRFGCGPGRRPVVRLLGGLRDPAQQPRAAPIPRDEAATAQGRRDQESGIELASRSLFSRAIRFHAPGIASFGWRYASASERAAACADSLLVCEVFAEAVGSESAKKKKMMKITTVKDGHRVAQLVRNEAFRSPGSSRASAGNGGRLMLDLAVFEEKLRERVEWLVVTTAVAMLKREVDRRRSQQIAVIGAVASS
ncbi:hypothetical protein F4824DRAFT_421580 [Ustulina deusta]|nr:hypothetical protein F4824DRAFT_421580 [Ustulina deusta]